MFGKIWSYKGMKAHSFSMERCVPVWQDKLCKAAEHTVRSPWGATWMVCWYWYWFTLCVEWKRIAVEKAVIHACQTQAGATAVSDGGRFKGQATRVTDSNAFPSISDHVLSISPLLSRSRWIFKATVPLPFWRGWVLRRDLLPNMIPEPLF